MRKIFKINPRDRKVYLGKDLEAEGYCSTGEIEGYPNNFTITLLKPGASLEQAIASLKSVIKDMEGRKADSDKKAIPVSASTTPVLTTPVITHGSNLNELRRYLKEGRDVHK